MACWTSMLSAMAASATVCFEHATLVNVLSFSNDGNTLATSTRYSGVARLWDAATLAPINVPPMQHAKIVSMVAFAPTGMIATASFDHTVCVWSNSATKLRTLQHDAEVLDVRFVGTSLVTHVRATISWWDAESGVLARKMQAHAPIMYLSAGETVLAYLALFERTVHVLDARTGAPLLRVEVPGRAPIFQLALSPDEKCLYIVTLPMDGDSAIIEVDLDAGTETKCIIDKPMACAVLACTPAGNLLATSYPDGGVRVWDINTRCVVASLAHHPSQACCLALAPSGTRLATSEFARSCVRVFDLRFTS